MLLPPPCLNPWFQMTKNKKTSLKIRALYENKTAQNALKTSAENAAFSVVFSVLCMYGPLQCVSPPRYAKVTRLKNQNPALKVLIAVGGWTMASAPFTKMVANAKTR